MHHLFASLPYFLEYDFQLGSVVIEDDLAVVNVTTVIRLRGHDSFMLAVTDKFDLIAPNLLPCRENVYCRHIDRVAGDPAGWHIVQIFNCGDKDLTMEEGNNVFKFEPLIGW